MWRMTQGSSRDAESEGRLIILQRRIKEKKREIQVSPWRAGNERLVSNDRMLQKIN